ncbi:ubiquitin C-terminal hydrolase 12-like [Gossypium arboreum]|uniref:ubiquitin C-terminal hydrolase 12-like n=1 Tax=Gossypium arboreum TaxID=29729 RepID=UPI000819204C|nr:ubiquitin C-terminal hydrolase 12-like [Gossypium arboreum]
MADLQNFFGWRILIFPKGNDVDHLSIYLDVANSAILPYGWSKYAQVGFGVINQFNRGTSIIRVKTDSDKLEAREVDCVKAFIDNQKTPTTKPVEITPPSRTQFSSQIVATEPEEPAEEDMNTFYTSLESEISCSRVVYSNEEAKEALDKINEALNITPVNLNDSGKFSPLKQAFMILARFDCSSTTLTIEQKSELLGLEERLKELANRAAKAV